LRNTNDEKWNNKSEKNVMFPAVPSNVVLSTVVYQEAKKALDDLIFNYL
jgi:hypothetical protein